MTSNGGYFTSTDDSDTFFSLSNFGNSYRLEATSRRFTHHHHMMTSIDETGSRSFSDQISTELYYRNNDGRKGSMSRQRMKKGGGAVIRDSYAVEKGSSNPQCDFRASMVEMSVEKMIFAAEDLERLLRSFLWLNSPSYHGIIFHVFSKICQTL